MHITPSVLANPKSGYGSNDHIIVHEWGHLRFGVFDEYPTIIRRGILQRFYNEGGTWKPVRANTKYTDFVLITRRLSDKLLSQGYVCDRLTSSLRKFYGRYGELVIHYDVPFSRMVDDILS
ncbi:hypothetical protein FSP39_003780 [Pinctada imbricata]|uniref:Calcium-activated chloride channel N-terminal domain-containing protein n=1 Tax=Pinctada imbricata TaxID=66713 RepID=A0AA89C8W6_PINIB|nr:hypothetical protein FSP39_003780 [Pinctada imbricata]